jgi:argininosuccinate lyase
MWKGRFAQDTSSLVQQFGESISYDWRLFPHDIAGSIAHARAQKTAGLLTDDEFSQIESGLIRKSRRTSSPETSSSRPRLRTST